MDRFEESLELRKFTRTDGSCRTHRTRRTYRT
jgi:hypothetical protein